MGRFEAFMTNDFLVHFNLIESLFPTMSNTAMALAAAGLVAVPAFLSGAAPRTGAPAVSQGLRGATQHTKGSKDVSDCWSGSVLSPRSKC